MSVATDLYEQGKRYYDEKVSDPFEKAGTSFKDELKKATDKARSYTDSLEEKLITQYGKSEETTKFNVGSFFRQPLDFTNRSTFGRASSAYRRNEPWLQSKVYDPINRVGTKVGNQGQAYLDNNARFAEDTFSETWNAAAGTVNRVGQDLVGAPLSKVGSWLDEKVSDPLQEMGQKIDSYYQEKIGDPINTALGIDKGKEKVGAYLKEALVKGVHAVADPIIDIFKPKKTVDGDEVGDLLGLKDWNKKYRKPKLSTRADLGGFIGLDKLKFDLDKKIKENLNLTGRKYSGR